MPQITELTWLPLKKDVENSAALASLKSMTPVLLAQPGLEAAYHGRPLEKPDSVESVSVWASEQKYKDAHASGPHADFTKLLKELVDDTNPEEHPYHNTVVFDKPFSTIASAPIVQITAIFLPTDVDKAAFEAAWDSITKSGGAPDGFLGGTHGWAVDEVEGHPKVAGKAKLFLTASGWESIEKNQAVSAIAKDKFAPLAKFSEVFEMHHTTFEKDK